MPATEMWRPFDSAPYDQKFLVCDMSQISEDNIEDWDIYCAVVWRCTDGLIVALDDDIGPVAYGYHGRQPTHWMPLPDPPPLTDK